MLTNHKYLLLFGDVSNLLTSHKYPISFVDVSDLLNQPLVALRNSHPPQTAVLSCLGLRGRYGLNIQRNSQYLVYRHLA
jgi:hypothetical protein